MIRYARLNSQTTVLLSARDGHVYILIVEKVCVFLSKFGHQGTMGRLSCFNRKY